MTGLGVVQLQGEDHRLARLRFPQVGVHAHFDHPAQLAGIVRPVEKVLGDDARLRGDDGVLPLRFGHVAGLANFPVFSVGAFLPFQVGALHPGAVGAFFVVAGSAIFRGGNEIVLLDDVVGRFQPRFRPHFGAPRLADEIEIIGRVPRKPGDGMANVAGDRFVGAGILLRAGWGSVPGHKSQRGVAAVAAGLHPGYFFILFCVRNRQFEVFDLVPVVGVGFRHHRLVPLVIKIHVAGFAHLRLLEPVVGVDTVGFIPGFFLPGA